MHCKICGLETERNTCKQCNYFLEKNVSEETLRKMYSDDETKGVWKENMKIASELAEVYYEYLIENYNNRLNSTDLR